MTSAILAACNALLAAENATVVAAENAPSSPGPNATITRCYEAEQAAIDNLVMAIEGEGYDVTNAADQKAAHDKADADAKAGRRTTDGAGRPLSPADQAKADADARAAGHGGPSDSRLQHDSAADGTTESQRLAAAGRPGYQQTHDNAAQTTEEQRQAAAAANLRQQQADAAKKPV